MEAVRILIVDDEIKICKLINKLIDWDTYGAELVGIAHDGVEGLCKIRELKPDIVFTDIRMPGYDGIELINQTKSFINPPRFVIISGHQQFDYALNAIKFGVEDYLVKPIKKQEINKIVERLCKMIRQRKAYNNRQMNMVQELNKSKTVLRQHLADIVLSEQKSHVEEIAELNEKYQLKFKPGYFQVICFKISGFKKQTNLEQFRHYINLQLRSYLEDRFLSICEDFILHEKDSRLYAVLNYTSQNQFTINHVYEWLDEGDKRLASYGNLHINISMGSVQEDFRSVFTSFSDAQKMMDAHLLGIKKRIFQFVDYTGLNQQDVPFITRKIELQLVDLIKRENEEAYRQWIEDLFRMIVREKKNDVILASIRSAIERLILTFIVTSQDINILPLNAEQAIARFRELMNEGDGIGEIKEYLVKLGVNYFSQMKQIRDEKEEWPVQVIKKYIHEHYREHISLEELSEQVHLNPVYLSALFKKTTSKTITDYMIDIRVQNAREMLKETNLNIAEVAHAVGYSDAKYFSRLFQRRVGIKPNEFRKFHK